MKNTIFITLLVTWSIWIGLGSYYYFFDQPNYMRIPLKLSSANTPVVEAVVEDVVCPLLFDLGFHASLELSQKVLSKVQKKEHGTKTWRDLRGHLYEAPPYILPKIRDVRVFLTENCT